MEEAGFIHHKLVDRELDTHGKLISQRLIQLWFAHPRQLAKAHRFVADSTLIIDATFNTNELRMPLIVAVGITNCGSTFPVAYSHCPSESTQSYEFFFECLKKEFFKENIPFCRVIIGDQAAGLISAISLILPNTVFQICDWHAVAAMVKKFTQSGGYNSERIDALKNLCWAYVQSPSFADLDINRQQLLNTLRPPEQQYILQIWGPKEPRIIYCYTRFFMNLGATASQRSEGYHHILRSVTNGQLSLKESAERLCSKSFSIFKDLDEDEDKSESTIPRLLQRDWTALDRLFNKISSLAINKIAEEWEITKKLAVNQNDLGFEPCHCQILLQWYLPCRHFLFEFAKTSKPIPLSLVHPRWLIHGPPIRFSGWNPIKNQQQNHVGERDKEQKSTGTDFLSPRRRQHTAKRQDILALRSSLPAIEKAEFDGMMARNDEQLLDQVRKAHKEKNIPIANPLPVPKRQIVKKRAHGKANARGLTGVELAEKDLKAKEAEQRQQEKLQKLPKLAAAPPRPPPGYYPAPQWAPAQQWAPTPQWASAPQWAPAPQWGSATGYYQAPPAPIPTAAVNPYQPPPSTAPAAPPSAPPKHNITPMKEQSNKRRT